MPKIIWRKWVDPLAHLLDKGDEDDIEDFDEISYDPDKSKSGNIGPAIIGPFGIIPIHEENLPSKLYDFWMGHTDFNITEGVANLISNVDGVESLDVYSRYRFRIAIGIAFDSHQVRQAIDRIFNKPPQAEDRLRPTRQLMQNRYKYWAIAVMPGGKHEMAGGDTQEEVEKKMAAFKDLAQELETSWINEAT